MDLKLKSDQRRYVSYIEVEDAENDILTFNDVIMYVAIVTTFNGNCHHYTAYASSVKDLFDDLWQKHGENTVTIKISSVFT